MLKISSLRWQWCIGFMQAWCKPTLRADWVRSSLHSLLHEEEFTYCNRNCQFWCSELNTPNLGGVCSKKECAEEDVQVTVWVRQFSKGSGGNNSGLTTSPTRGSRPDRPSSSCYCQTGWCYITSFLPNSESYVIGILWVTAEVWLVDFRSADSLTVTFD